MLANLLTIAMGAAPGGAGQEQSPLYSFGMIAIMIVIFYFMLIRPQQRREKERRSMMDSVKSGDRVAFSGGILGVVTNVKEKTLMIKVADNVKIEVSRAAVTQVLEKGEQPDESEKK